VHNFMTEQRLRTTTNFSNKARIKLPSLNKNLKEAYGGQEPRSSSTLA
jgi:hypothetical protein